MAETAKTGQALESVTAPSGDDTDVSAPWDEDNQAWWDWYVGLADNGLSREQSDGDDQRMAVTLEPDPARTLIPPLAILRQELAKPYPLSDSHIEAFAKTGFVKLPDVLSAGAVAALRQAIVVVLETEFDTRLDQPAARGLGAAPAAGRRFYSAEMVWLDNALIRLFVLSPRIAGISAALLKVPAVRLYHDNLLSKEPGCGRTPWHFDDHHFPLATHDVVTAWIAAQAIPRAMGPLSFASDIDAWRLVEDVPFSKSDTSYDRHVGARFADAGVPIDDSPFAVGEVSFHHNLSFHTAGGNDTSLSRCALANTYFADGARIVDAPTMVSGDWQKFMPGTSPGAVAKSSLNPICWPPAADWTMPPPAAAPQPNRSSPA
ncbi:MAG: phytanoyl-CoA dioxygenase family protein [Pseudomonadota bacterium]